MNTKRPTVWVLKEQVKAGATGPTPMDYTAAYDFGDVRFVTDFDPPLHSPSTLREVWDSNVDNFTKEFNVNSDYVVLTGSPLAIFMIGSILADNRRIDLRKLQVLVWRREQSRYNVVFPFANRK